MGLTDLASWWGSQLSAATILAHKKANNRERAKPKPNTQTSIYSPTQKPTTHVLRGRPSRILRRLRRNQEGLYRSRRSFRCDIPLKNHIGDDGRGETLDRDAAKRSIAMRRRQSMRDTWRTVRKSKSSTSGDLCRYDVGSCTK